MLPSVIGSPATNLVFIYLVSGLHGTGWLRWRDRIGK